MAKTPLERDELGRIIIHDTRNIPHFKTEVEEQGFWDAHTLSAELFQESSSTEYPDPSKLRRSQERPKKQSSSTHIRFDADTTRRLKALAAVKGTKYQTLLKQFVVERLYEEEKREGIVS
ncbi:MAG: hypothetical protein JSV66_01015 [Trueperaceae bacterium]|nr:MAG: hypothetical protein JSV66_01015 [Trueperaceae bacterium]